MIRRDFHREVEGTLPILTKLASRCELALLSDHAREWIAYIESIHPFLEVFEHTFYSYDLGKLKREPETFLNVLDAISLPHSSCLFIDDNPVNVAVARSVDIPSIRFVNARQLASKLERQRVVVAFRGGVM